MSGDTAVAAALGKPITVLICALGGEGGGVLAEWLVQAATSAGHSVQSTSIPGVAQRTGATTYYVEVFAQPNERLQGRRPVFSLTPVPGALDVLVSSELLETARQVGQGMTSPDRTQVISSWQRTLTVAEKVALADGRSNEARLRKVVAEHCQTATFIDMGGLAAEAGTVLSAVMFGAIAASAALPFAPQACRATVQAGGKGVEASLRGFDAGYAAVVRARDPLAPPPAAPVSTAAPAPGEPLAPWAQALPAAAQDMVRLGHARVLEYQDARYAGLFLERVERVARAEGEADPQAVHQRAATREAARYLALWMAFDDIVRVAQLKSAARRLDRVRDEVRARDDEVVRIFDHFKPTVAEFAAILPPKLSAALIAWDRRRRSRGLPAWAVAIKLPTHTVWGMLVLRLLVALKRVRPRGSRFIDEQRGIERWLRAVEDGARQDAALGLELAECGRLIKGYGATHDRGKDNLLHILESLASATASDNPAARAATIGSARRAALADDGGTLLDQTLARHGARARPPTEHPVHWVRQRPAGRAGRP